MRTRTPTSTHTTGGTPTPTTKSFGVSVSSLFKKIGPRLLLLLVMVLSAWLAIAQFTPPAVVPKPHQPWNFQPSELWHTCQRLPKSRILWAHLPVRRCVRISYSRLARWALPQKYRRRPLSNTGQAVISSRLGRFRTSSSDCGEQPRRTPSC